MVDLKENISKAFVETAGLRRELWEGLATGRAAVMVWPHVLVDKTDSWRVFEPVMRVANDLPLNRRKWRPVEAQVTRAESSMREACSSTLSVARSNAVRARAQ